MTKCVIISSQSLFLLEYSSKGLSNKCIYWVYLKTSKPRCARELLYPSPPATPSTFGARLTPLNRTSFEKRKKQSFNGFCHIPFLWGNMVRPDSKERVNRTTSLMAGEMLYPFRPSLPGQGQDRPTALVIVPNRHSSFSINTPFFVLIVLHLQIVPA